MHNVRPYVYSRPWSDTLMEDVATAAISEPSYSKDGNAISAKGRVEKIVPGFVLYAMIG